MSRISVNVVRSFMGNCLIITDNETNKNIEVMAMQLKAIVNAVSESGELPHGGWDKEGEFITIHHDDDRDSHEVTFTLNEVAEAL